MALRGLVVWGLVVLLGCTDETSDSAGTGGSGGASGARDGGGEAGSRDGGGSGGAGGGAGGTGGSGGGGGGAASCMDDAGCPAGARCDTEMGVCRPACGSDFECGTSAACDLPRGLCVPLARCGPDQTCPDGAACNCHGVCEPAGEPACRMDSQCPVEAYCDDCAGHCKPRVRHCGRCGGSSNACERRNDRCLPVGRAGTPHCLRACTGQPVCDALGPGFECRAVDDGRSVCVPRGGECSAPGDCAADRDCPDGHFCNDALFCQRGCEEDTACPNDQVCTNLRCRPPCAADPDCAPNGVCGPDGHCQVPGGCVSSADCLEPETHCDVAMQQCVPGCERDNDCLDATKGCVGGACRPLGCAGNYQCAFEEVCDLETAECKPAGGVHCQEGCDPQDQDACGGPPNRCLSLQDEDENPIGDFCFEACLEPPNECPQGYECVDLEDQDGNVTDSLCVRRCDYTPVQ